MLRSAKESRAGWPIAAVPARARSGRRISVPPTFTTTREKASDGLRPAERPTPPSRPTRRLSTSRSSSTGTANDTNAGPQGKWTAEMPSAGMMQNVVRGELDRLQMRGEQLEVLGAERSQQIVPGPTGHASCLVVLGLGSCWPGIGTSENPTFPRRNRQFQSEHKCLGKSKSSQPEASRRPALRAGHAANFVLVRRTTEFR